MCLFVNLKMTKFSFFAIFFLVFLHRSRQDADIPQAAILGGYRACTRPELQPPDDLTLHRVKHNSAHPRFN